MIHPDQLNESHKGSKVVYLNRTQDGTLLVREWGYITGWNERNVWVSFPYSLSGGSALCRPESLFFYEVYELFVHDPQERATQKDLWGWDKPPGRVRK